MKKISFGINFSLFLIMITSFICVFFSLSKNNRNGHFQHINKPKYEIQIANTTDATAVIANILPTTFAFATNIKAINTGYMYANHIVSLFAILSTCQILKYAINESRPDDQNDTKSFPSGHSAFAFCGAINLILMVRTRRKQMKQQQEKQQEKAQIQTKKTFFLNIIVNIMCILNLLLAFSTALGRVLAHRHWPIDVFCGSFLGIIGTIVVYIFLKNFRNSAELKQNKINH